MVEGACWSFRIRIRKSDKLYLLTQTCIQPTNKLVSSLSEAPLVLGQATATLDSQDSPRPGLGGSHHLPPYSIIYTSPWHLHPNDFLSRDSQGGVPKLSRFGLPPLCGVITLCSDLRLQWGLNQTCSSRQELSKGVPHSTWMHRGWVNSWLLVVGSQIASLIPDLSFCHNLCYKCPNGSCKPIFNTYISIAFQWYKERHNARCFDPCNQTLKFWESQRTPKFPFRECESHPHTLLKVGLRHLHKYLLSRFSFEKKLHLVPPFFILVNYFQCNLTSSWPCLLRRLAWLLGLLHNWRQSILLETRKSSRSRWNIRSRQLRC